MARRDALLRSRSAAVGLHSGPPAALCGTTPLVSGDATCIRAERGVAIWREARARQRREDLARPAAPSLIERERLRRLASSTPSWVAPDPILQAEILRREREVLEREAALREQRPRLDRRFPRFYIEQGRSAFDHVLVAMEMEETFEQGRRLQMRLRAPYWDSELLAYLYRTPPELLNRGGWSKGLVRESVARRFPSFGFERQRKVTCNLVRAIGGAARRAARPFETWLGATALEEAGDRGSGVPMRAHLERLLDEPRVRRFNVIWDLLSLECWLQAHR